MLLSDFTQKNIYVNKTPRGTCKGIVLSLKSYAVKYLLCSSTTTQSSADFAVSISAILECNNVIHLSRLRPVHPGNYAKITLGIPIYSFEGGYLGRLTEISMDNFIATRLFTDRGNSYPITAVFACSDALILKKEQPYPLGQRIPAPLLSTVTDKSDGVVTKTVLRNAMKEKALVKLTLALPPFHLHLSNPSHGIFRR